MTVKRAIWSPRANRISEASIVKKNSGGAVSVPTAISSNVKRLRVAEY